MRFSRRSFVKGAAGLLVTAAAGGIFTPDPTRAFANAIEEVQRFYPLDRTHIPRPEQRFTLFGSRMVQADIGDIITVFASGLDGSYTERRFRLTGVERVPNPIAYPYTRAFGVPLDGGPNLDGAEWTASHPEAATYYGIGPGVLGRKRDAD